MACLPGADIEVVPLIRTCPGPVPRPKGCSVQLGETWLREDGKVTLILSNTTHSLGTKSSTNKGSFYRRSRGSEKFICLISC